MKVMIKLDKDWEIEAEIPDSEIEKIKRDKRCQEKNGYERIVNQKYYYADIDNDVTWDEDKEDSLDRDLYNAANYYSDISVAENNARADKLMRQLRRFAIEHRETILDWGDDRQRKYFIYYNYDNGFDIEFEDICKTSFAVYFDTHKTAKLAIDTFRDELIWYFTEYKDSL